MLRSLARVIADSPLTRRIAFRVGCSSAFLVFSLSAIPILGGQPPGRAVIQQSASSATVAVDITELTSGNNPITVEMRGGELRDYRVTLGAGTYVEFVAEQQGIDVVLVLHDPAGAPLLSVDSPNGAQGPETLSWIAKVPGLYTLEIRPSEKDAAPGKCEFRIAALRPAVPQDEIRVQATVALAAGQIALDEDSETSYPLAVAKFKEALPLLQQLHDSYREYFAIGGLCHELEDLNQYQEALRYCQLAEQTADARKDKIDHATWKHRLALAFEQTGQKDQAATAYEQTAKEYSELGDKRSEVRVLSRLSVLYINQDQMPPAESSLQRELDLLESLGDEKEMAVCLNRLGFVQRSLKHNDKVIATHTAAMEAARKAGDKTQEALAHGRMGKFYMETNVPLQAINEFKSELQLRQELQDKAAEADCYINLASAWEAGRYTMDEKLYSTQREEYLSNALSAAREAKTVHKQAYILWLIGNSSHISKPYSRALTDAERTQLLSAKQSLIESKDLYSTSGTPLEVAQCWTDIAKIDRVLDDHQSVLLDFQSAIEIYRKSNASDELAQALTRLADYYCERKDYLTAQTTFKDLEDVWGSQDNAKEKALAIAGQGEMQLGLGNAPESLKLFETSLATFGDKGDVHGRAEVYRYIGIAYLKLMQDDKALDAFNHEFLLMKDENAGVLHFLEKLGADQLWDPELTARQKEILAQPALTSLASVWDWFAFTSFLNWDHGVRFIDISREIFRSRKLLQADDSLNLGTVLQLQMELAIANEHFKALIKQNEPLKTAFPEQFGEKPKSAQEKNLQDLKTKADHLQYAGDSGVRRESCQKAIGVLEQALEIRRKLGDPKDIAQTMTSLGEASLCVNEGEKSLAAYQDAREEWKKSDSFKEEDKSLIEIGVVYNWLGDRQNAIASFQEALQLAKARKLQDLEASALYHIGETYLLLGEKRTALDNLFAARDRSRNDDHPDGDGQILSLIGFAYDSLGDKADSLNYYRLAASEFDRAFHGSLLIFDVKKKAHLYNDLGDAYYAMGDSDRALGSFQTGLIMQRNFGRLSEQAYALEKIGLISLSSPTPEKLQTALASFEESLALTRKSGNPSREAEALHNLATACERMGDRQRALSLYGQALAIRNRLKDPEGQGETLDRLMHLWKSMNQPALAAFYGKQAVNMFQQIRVNMQGIGEDLQKSYLGSHSATYRELADTLIVQGRIPEAQQVLDLLKNEEYLDFIRRDGAEAMIGSAEYAARELSSLQLFNHVQDHIMRTGQRYAALSAKDQLTPAEKTEFARLEKELVAENEAYDKYLAALPQQFAVPAQGEAKADSLREAKGLQETLRELGNGTVALYTVVTEDRYHVILITPEIQKPFTYEIKAAELNRKIQEFRNVLMNPRLDPAPLSRDLYKILVGPVEGALQDAQAKTLMWSLDGALRYVPIAALNDGHQYLVEKYDLTIFTPASHSRLERPAPAKWRGLGLGVSKGPNPLPNVTSELHSVIHDDTDADSEGGVVSGKILLDESFTKDAMKDALQHGKGYSLVHVASHFRFKPGNEYDSYLLLGGAEQASDERRHLTLAEIKSGTNIFRGVELLTLSACNTAVGSGEGSEVENFAVLAQLKGARAVIATLWPVADVSTMHLMQEFYRLHDTRPDVTKVESLREAQLSLLRGCSGENCTPTSSTLAPSSSDLDQSHSGNSTEFHTDPRAPYAHPYFWAPFVLIGNWR